MSSVNATIPRGGYSEYHVYFASGAKLYKFIMVADNVNTAAFMALMAYLRADRSVLPNAAEFVASNRLPPAVIEDVCDACPAEDHADDSAASATVPATRSSVV